MVLNKLLRITKLVKVNINQTAGTTLLKAKKNHLLFISFGFSCFLPFINFKIAHQISQTETVCRLLDLKCSK